MTHVFTFSGVHGSGKTTIINHIANRLTNIGKKVFVLNEFPYIPEVPMGTMDFQAWYQNAMEQRCEVVNKVIEMKLFDIILLDRHPLDVDVYSLRLINTSIPTKSITSQVPDMHKMWYHDMKNNHIWRFYSGMFVFERPCKELVESLKFRKIVEGHREAWNEEDSDYLGFIMGAFHLFKKNPNVIFIENKDLKDTKDLVFEHIVQRLKK